jgi:hypothetical protein
VVRAAGWHAGDLGFNLSRDGLYTCGCIPQRYESASVEILRSIKTLIYLFIYLWAAVFLCANYVMGKVLVSLAIV